MNKLIFAALACGFALHASAAPRFVYSPYQHVSESPAISDAPGPITWAFATGECGDEQWGTFSGQQVADANVAAFDAAGTGYMVSTGGQGGVFTCATDDGMERFIARYASPHLLGIDFDIEAGQTAEQVESLILRIQAAQRRHARLRFSFTVATHAASDGSGKSLNGEGEAILAALRRHGVREFTLNLMVMDYGPGTRALCVLKRGGLCDMGKSAIQAARNVSGKYGVPLAQLELTAMIGVNDVVSNVFTLDDARLLAAAARTMKLAGVHYWSLGRDRPCPQPIEGASAACSGMPYPPRAYLRALGQ
ncbi:MAG: glycosyl hydrolase [Pseudomonadota bacterium]